jgi:hypothetical protein
VTKNVTVTVDDAALLWARHRAADLDTSVSRLIGDLLEREMLSASASGAAFERFQQRSAKGWPMNAANRLSREEANERRSQ